jgi:probable HAF family extracellular repeat protein
MRKFLLTTTALLSLAAATQARAYDELTSIATIPGQSNTQLYGISGNGRYLYGYAYTNSGIDGNGVLYDLQTDSYINIGNMVGGYNVIHNTSNDGSIVFGYEDDGSGITDAFIYQGGVFTNLTPLLPGATASSSGQMSDDGTVFVGQYEDGVNPVKIFVYDNGVATILTDFYGMFGVHISRDGDSVLGFDFVAQEAAIWSGGVYTYLGNLGGSSSQGYSLSGDGTTVVGQSETAASEYHAFRWNGGVMQNLAPAGADDSTAEIVSADGSVVVGWGLYGASGYGFRWEGGTHVDLGDRAQFSEFIASGMDDSGDKIVGISIDNSTNNHYFLWESGIGYQDVETLLAGNGVDLTGWDLVGHSNGLDIRISRDGEIIFGQAQYNSNDVTFLMTSQGITTPEDLTETLIPVAQTRQQTVSGLNVGTQQSLFASRQAFSGFRGDFFMPDPSPENLASLAPAAGGHTFDSPALASRYSAYVTGAIGVGASNNSANTAGYGTTGLFARISDEWAVGLGVITGSSFTQLKYGGEGRLTGFGGALNIAHESADSGWRIYGTATVQSLNLDMDRNYINGSGIDGSTGETDGIGFAGAVQLGYALPVSQTVSLMPYASIDASRTRMDGYSETGGAFPATFSKQTATVINGHLGVEASYQATSNFTLKGRTAWGHQLESRSNSATATALSITYTLPYEDGAPNWVETGITANWQVSDRLNMTTDLAGRFGNTGKPAASVTVGLSYGF